MKTPKKLLITCITLFISAALLSLSAWGAPAVYVVKPGDTLWKIATAYEIGLSEIKAANPQIKNFDLIYPGDKISIPEATPLKSFEDEVVRLVNIERTNRGLPALTVNWQLARVARYKSQDMVNRKYFSHDSPTYGSPFTMIESFGIRFTAAAENIAYGQRTPADVMRDWMNSPGHRSNILTANVTQIGVGAAKASNGTLYWTQMFIRPR